MVLLCQKGIYPYTHMKNFEAFEESCLPSKEAFHNDLTGDETSKVANAKATNQENVFGQKWEHEFEEQKKTNLENEPSKSSPQKLRQDKYFIVRRTTR